MIIKNKSEGWKKKNMNEDDLMQRHASGGAL